MYLAAENIHAVRNRQRTGSNRRLSARCGIRIHAYDRNGQSQKAWEWTQKAEQKFPESAMLHIYSGDLCKALERYEDAFAHWQRAKEMEPTWMDSWYAMGFCYEELGDYANAYQIWNAIADDLAARGFEAEVNWPKAQAKKCLEKMQK